MTTMKSIKNTTAWYREPWPWILMIAPVATIIAGAITSWLAFTTADGLVEDDYYKQGLAVNQRKHRDMAAAAGAVSAEVMLGEDKRSVRLLLASPRVEVPDQLGLSFVHPTRSGFDQKIALHRQSDGLYAGRLDIQLAGRWHVALEDPSGKWRLLADWDVGDNSSLRMAPIERGDHAQTGG